MAKQQVLSSSWALSKATNVASRGYLDHEALYRREVRASVISNHAFHKIFNTILLSSHVQAKTLGQEAISTRVQEAVEIQDLIITGQRAPLIYLAATTVYQYPCGNFHDLRCRSRKLRSSRVRSCLHRRIAGQLHSRACVDRH